MTIPPFTHHEIIGLVEPFARGGWQADLALSDRLARRLVFKSRDHGRDPESDLACRESLELGNATPGLFRLTRTLTLVGGLQAVLWSEGDDPAGLLAAIESVPQARQVRCETGFVMALGHALDGPGRLRLTHGAAQAGGLTVALTMPTRGARRADVVLSTRVDDPVELPDDLLAVLGWDWSRLDRWTEGATHRWTGSVRLRRGVDDDAERKLAATAAHVARTLAESPARFHERLRNARWGFAFRRAIPLMICVALLVATFAFARAGISNESVLRMLVFNAPPLLLVAFFCLREVPRIELPRPPRRSDATAWRIATREAAGRVEGRAVESSSGVAMRR